MIGQFGGLCILMGKLKAKGQKIYVFEENKKDSGGGGAVCHCPRAIYICLYDHYLNVKLIF